MAQPRRMPRLLALVLATPLAFAAGCGPSVDPKVAGAKAVVDRWMVRAQSSFKAGDLDDAREAAQAALKAAPKDASVRVLNARLALARLDFVGLDTSFAILETLHSSFGDDNFAPRPMLRSLVSEGRLGRKTKAGFYVY